ncbi:hypothetical protein [Halorubrum sp. C191]|uniref:hypothetical protein n=1 Tax=Halorubrum sp. C191 TaxID=1383842 RepID=UPI00118198AC|nr:hypothetical protein [Halorubrum sp. C191]
MDSEGINEAYLRETMEGRRDRGEPAPHPILQLIEDEHARRSVSTIITALDISDEHPNFDDTAIPNAVADGTGANTLNNALDDENMSKLAFYKGVDDGDDTFYNVTEYVESQWSNRIDGNAVQKSLINGDEGAGKSSWMMEEGFLIAPRVIKRETDKNILGISNVDVVPETTNLDKFENVDRTSKLDELVDEYGSKSDWEIVVALDEGDQLFGGTGRSTQRADALGDRIKLMRHNNAHILMTSQRLVAPEIRNRFKVRHKPSDTQPYRMQFAESTDENGEPEDVRFRTRNVPETQVDYGGAGNWTHDIDGEGEEDDRVKELEEQVEATEEEANRRLWLLYSETDMSYREVGQKVGLSKSQVYDRVEEFREKNDID